MRAWRGVLFVALAGGLVHALVTFPNHFLFRTYALDLGLYTHAAWTYLNGGLADTALFQEVVAPMLADHFDLYLLLVSPLLLIFGTWTLLFLQWASIIFGAFGVRRYLLTRGMEPSVALVGMSLFFLFFGVFAASSFDYHSNVVAAMLLPWCLDAVWRGRRWRAFLFCAGMLVAKENIGLWSGSIMAILAMDRSLSMTIRRMAMSLAVLSFVWSAIIIGVVMPTLAADGQYAHFDYRIVAGLFQGDRPPWDLLRALFIDLEGSAKGTAIKVEFWVLLMLSGGWAFVLRPAWGMMAVPLIVQKMWHDEPSKWGAFGQYCIEFAPLVAISVPLVLATSMAQGARRWALFIALGMAMACTIRIMDNTVAHMDRSRIRLYKAEHYRREYDVQRVRDVVASLPPGVVVSAQSPAVPHLALRSRLFQFPILRDAEAVVLMPQESTYPLSESDYRRSVDSLMNAADWRVEVRDTNVILLRRDGREVRPDAARTP